MTASEALATTPNIDKVHKIVVSLSGGLDSTILLTLMVHRFGKENVHAISFDYNQRHDIELTCARRTVQKLGVTHYIADISFLGTMAEGVSAMVKGSIATPTMEDVLGEPQPVTYMPNRNMILAAITASYAESIGADGIALGINPKLDGHLYYDCTESYMKSLQKVFDHNRKHPISILTPFNAITKSEIIKLGSELNVDLTNTFTCYDPKISADGRVYTPCGVCPSCFPRKAGFEKAGIEDPLVSVSI